MSSFVSARHLAKQDLVIMGKLKMHPISEINALMSAHRKQLNISDTVFETIHLLQGVRVLRS